MSALQINTEDLGELSNRMLLTRLGDANHYCLLHVTTGGDPYDEAFQRHELVIAECLRRMGRFTDLAAEISDALGDLKSFEVDDGTQIADVIYADQVTDILDKITGGES